MERRSEKSSELDLSWIDGRSRINRSVLQEFYAQHFPAVRGYVLQNSGTVSDAEDVFQEAMTALLVNTREGRVKVGDESNIGGYVFRIAKNKWLDQVRSARVRLSGTMPEHGIIKEPVGDEVDTERIEHLQGIYQKLDSRCRQVLDLFYYEKQDLRSIARTMGVDESSIRTIKYRCMMKLRNYHLDATSSDKNTDQG